MKAAILTESRKPLVVADLTMPPVGVGQVRVTMHYAAICGAQIGEIDAKKGPDKFLPHLLGHEGVGTVAEIGPGVTTKRVGDVVVCHWRPSEGIAAKGAIYDWNGQPVNSGPMTCFSTETIVSENRLTILPTGITQRDAPLFGCAWTTAYGVITHDAQVKPGDTVIVFGCGGVGKATIQIAVLAGAYPVIGVDPVASKRTAARGAGAHGTMRPSEVEGVYRGADVVIDTTGLADVIELAYRITAPQGRTILVGVPAHDDPIRIDSLPLHFGKVLTGSQGGECRPHLDIPRLAKLVRAGKLDIRGHITHEFPLARINEALDVVRSGEAGRVLLRMDA